MSGEVVDAVDGDFMGWLQVTHEATAPPDGSDLGEILRWYRKHEKLTQQDAASLLNTTQSRLSKLEKGAQALRNVTELRYIARQLGIPPERLGVLPDQSRDASPFPCHVSDRPGTVRAARNAGETSDVSSTPTGQPWAISPPSCIRGSSALPERRSSPRPAGYRMVPSTWLISSWRGALSHRLPDTAKVKHPNQRVRDL